MTKLSIITINLNNAEGLRKTIESVINQTFTDFEYIIIDGGSTDESVDIIRQFADRITYWISEPDTGIYNAMNKGIKKAEGEYLQFLNSGDWLYSESILKEVFALNRTEDILYGNDALFYNEQHITFKTYPTKLTGFLLYTGTISHQATFHKATLFDTLYDEHYKIASDWKFQIEKIIFENCSTYYLNKTIIYFDMMGISQNQVFSELQNNERTQILSEYFPERILADYQTLQQLKSEQSTKYIGNIKTIMLHPWLWRLVRRFISIMASFAKVFQA
ncbi:glycosyltransferase family 2 protein [Microbacter margulisiae]|uniref:Glycosyltransferase involved in cell wall biosynthesis n=1 Tax=Microbacter margulisiae TaxID=1350067 RepID=A0A7W5H3F3_9PORP|nr:glycosyltransferase family 2 protein [Microbacter margulisiae]MBB3188406.1 glycosyltransferase involved in cell wall biosynthesis [Microbacter margulisiae]